jgi:hypothetical protein
VSAEELCLSIVDCAVPIDRYLPTAILRNQGRLNVMSILQFALFSWSRSRMIFMYLLLYLFDHQGIQQSAFLGNKLSLALVSVETSY